AIFTFGRCAATPSPILNRTASAERSRWSAALAALLFTRTTSASTSAIRISAACCIRIRSGRMRYERRGRGTTPWQHESPRTPPPDSIPTLPHPGGGVAVGWPPGRGKGAEGPPPPTPAFRLPAIHPSLTIGL